eukprot:365308-Chlamydomonas_euryale.AAC.4
MVGLYGKGRVGKGRRAQQGAWDVANGRGVDLAVVLGFKKNRDRSTWQHGLGAAAMQAFLSWCGQFRSVGNSGAQTGRVGLGGDGGCWWWVGLGDDSGNGAGWGWVVMVGVGGGWWVWGERDQVGNKLVFLGS